MELDPLFLSRVQFAFVVSFHAIFPVFSIGLAAYIAVLEGIYYKTDDPSWLKLSKFWTKVFAIVFGMGVVSGIVMAFQFGTNWSNYSYAASNFIGPLLAYEVVTAFFLEATFLGVLLFGRDKVPRGLHLFAACMVAIGTTISSFWILSANSWMQTPAGVEMVDGMIHMTSWTQAIFNSSFPYRFAHFLLASFITGGFVVAGVSAWYLLHGRHGDIAEKALKMCVIMLAVATPLQLLSGDMHGLNTLEEQPVKVAAMEGNWETGPNIPLLLFAIPDMANETNHFEIGIPNGASLILKHSADGVVPGLKSVPPEERPPVGVTFWSFRVMVAIGMLMIAVSLWGAVQLYRRKLYESTLLLKILSWMIPLPFLAVIAGWFVTEIGRQPWIIYGMMTVGEGLTPSLTGWMALTTLIGYFAVYAVVFASGLYYLRKVIMAGPDPVEESHERITGTPKRPWSAVDGKFEAAGTTGS
ncbi:cytochrome ubiquinol oxidase subunit I [Thioalkalivibrio sp. XN279]|uniref:cytochrome ubiquinol oxidase subunit I n=1 Tax=Thioalkalivibrio sp. XN279 TaxID=2714953 RepID=UPI0014095D5F|nr:cytochrome ubiquinol oxidase subunit I [Thioalkalivibrio sp. XN279]NHA15496.1 cytochrome ubiquinol oxidase subunit I [Thioalkalivibrio sp. XN279]